MANEELIADLVARIRTVYDESGAKRADAAVRGLGKSLDDQTKGPSARFAGAQQLLKNKLESFAGGGNIATKSLGDLSKAGILSGEALSTGLAGGAVVAAAAIAKMASDGIGKFVGLTAEIRGFQRVAGTSAEDSSKLVGALHLLGIEPATVEKAFGLLSKTIENTPKKLADLGIQVAKNKQGNTDLVGTLFNVSDAFKATDDQAKKNTIALTAFGRGGLALVPILQRGREGIEELFKATGKSGLIFDQAALERGRQFSLAGKELKESFSGLEISIGEKLVPVLTEAAGIATKVVDFVNKGVDVIGKIKLPGEKGSLFGDVFKEATGIGAVSQAVDFLSGKHDKASASGDKLKATEKDVADAMKEAARQADANAKALDNLINAQLAAFDSSVEVERSRLAVRDATAAVTEKEKAAAEAVRLHGANSAEASQAQEDLAKATLDEEAAASSMTAAFTKYTQEQAAASGETVTASKKIDDQITVLQGLAATTSGPTAAALQGLIANLQAVKSKEIDVTVNVSDAERALDQLKAKAASLSDQQFDVFLKNRISGARALGGPVLPGHAYLVNENTPRSEIFVPSVPGVIIPTGGTAGGDGASASGISGPGGAGLAELVAAIERLAGRAVVVQVGETELARTIAGPVTIAQTTSRGARRR